MLLPDKPTFIRNNNKKIAIGVTLSVICVILIPWLISRNNGAWVVPAFFLPASALAVIGRMTIAKDIDGYLVALSKVYFISHDDTNMKISIGGIQKVILLRDIKSIYASYPILYVKTRGFRLDQKVRVSLLKKDDVTEFIASVQRGLTSH